VKALLALTAHSLRRRRVFTLGVCAALFAFELFMVLSARSMQLGGAFSTLGKLMPEFIRTWTNMAAATYGGMVVIGHVHPIVVLFLVAQAVVVAIEPADEIESRFTDVVMSRPVPRSTPINRSVLALMAMIGTATGSWLLTPAGVAPPEARTVLTVSAALALIVLAWGGIALAIAARSQRRATAAGAATLLVFVMYVLDYVGRFWQAAEPVSRISPFHYYNPFQIIGGAPLHVSDVVILAAIALLGFALAHVFYARRDL
jgi:ABC-type transport system involved in multi-copper enzyme maturation permease subunit